MERVVWTLVVAVAVCVTWTSAQSAVWNRRKDGRLHVSVEDIPGVHNVQVTVQGDKGLQSTVFIPKASVDKTWRAVTPDVVKDDVIQYVIEYQLADSVHRIAGSYSFIPTGTEVALGSERYLQRRATTVFFDDFSSGHDLDSAHWSKSNTAVGLGGFQIWSPENAFVKNHMLYIKPTLTVDRFGQNIMQHGVIDVKELWGYCWEGGTCVTRDHENRPVISATIRTKNSVNIRYGRVEVVAKMPKGDWLWGAIWMMPTESHYGKWPRSGEIDLIEIAGNVHLLDKQGHSVGVNKEMCHIHFGPTDTHPAHQAPGGEVRLNSPATFADAFHTYWLDWTQDHIKMGVDQHLCVNIHTPDQGFWVSTHQHGTNIWANGGKNAPFDRPFYLILDVAVAGDARFWNIPANELPWTHDDPNGYRQFWNNRHQWLPTWHGDDVAMKVRSVKMQQY